MLTYDMIQQGFYDIKAQLYMNYFLKSLCNKITTENTWKQCRAAVKTKGNTGTGLPQPTIF